jgi:hypothetical protein
VESTPCHTLPHPCPTPQAVAHEAGGGWCIIPTIICSPPSFINTAVSTHPPAQRAHTTSCIAPLPPHEQWLMAVVMGAFAVGCGGLQLPHPCPTPRAVAREAGGGWCIVPTVICPPLPHRSPIQLLAPAIHPTSSCSWGWGRVLCCCVVIIIVVSSSSSLLLLCHHHCCCVIIVIISVVVSLSYRCPPSHHCMAPGAPAIHPTSSCSSAWGWVLH